MAKTGEAGGRLAFNPPSAVLRLWGRRWPFLLPLGSSLFYFLVMRLVQEKSPFYLTSEAGEAYTNPFVLFSCLEPPRQKKPLYGNFEHAYYRIGARYYDADIGMWISPDPERQYNSLYTYCGNDPLNCIDEDGLSGGAIARRVFRVGPKLVRGNVLNNTRQVDKALLKSQDVMMANNQQMKAAMKRVGGGKAPYKESHMLSDGAQGETHWHASGHPEGVGHGFVGKLFGAVAAFLALTDYTLYAEQVMSPDYGEFDSNNFDWDTHYKAVDTNPLVVDLLSE